MPSHMYAQPEALKTPKVIFQLLPFFDQKNQPTGLAYSLPNARAVYWESSTAVFCGNLHSQYALSRPNWCRYAKNYPAFFERFRERVRFS